MIVMVIEDFKGSDPKAIRERFVRDGRMLPDGVIYHASWVDPANLRCSMLFVPWGWDWVMTVRKAGLSPYRALFRTELLPHCRTIWKYR
jgi:hypothetical protein